MGHLGGIGSSDTTEGDWAAEQSKREALSETEQKHMQNLAELLEESGENLPEDLTAVRIDMKYIEGAKKLKDNPEVDYNGLSWNSLTEAQREFINRIIAISEDYETNQKGAA